MSTKTSHKRIFNINVGVLGHVDSGKTSLVAALSTQLSTAALDKHPQSKERGITLDLGFSAFTVPMPAHLAHLPYDELQFTLVDCPGHASLIRTIIGGVQIIDMMILVIDITKGLQTQTAECLVVGEVATSRMVVALNKVDMLQPPDERPKAVRRAIKRLSQTFAMTKFVGVQMVPVSAKPGGQSNSPALGVDDLKAALVGLVPPTPRVVGGSFLFAVDHCFPIRGQGSVMTGTVLQGSISVNDTLELPALKQTRPVKSIQMFRSPVPRAAQGDRVGLCVSQLDSGLLERGLACAPGTVPTFRGAVAAVEKIRFFAGRVPSRSKFHVSVGHSTVMAEMTFFGVPDGQGLPEGREGALAAMIANLNAMALVGTPMTFDTARDYLYQEELYGLEGRPLASPVASASGPGAVEGGGGGGGEAGGGEAGGGEAGGSSPDGAAGAGAGDCEAPDRHFGPQWVLLKFDQAITAPQDALVIGAKFDADIHGEACRLAFYGRLVALVDPSRPEDLARLRVFKVKVRSGVIERVQPDGVTAIVRSLIKKESDVAVFVGLQVTTGRGEEGKIEGSFGKSGKLKVNCPGGLATSGRTPEDNVVTLRCKRYIFDPNAKKVLRQ